MADPAESENQNLLPVQAFFSVDGEFQTFIGQGQPFYATVNPDQSGLHITNSTIDSTTIGATTPSTGVFTNVSTTTGTISTAPTGNNDITNKQYVDAIAQGLNPKQAVKCATTANITLSGLQTIDTYTTLAGDRVLVKNQSTDSQNGIYIAGASAWTRATDMDVWSEVPGAYTVVLNGFTNVNTGWVSNSTDTGTIGVTPITFVQFSGTGTYYAGTGLTLGANTFSITDTGVTAATKGSASKTVTAAVNAQGQLTSLTDQDIAIAGTQITSGTIDSARLSGSYTGITGVGTLTAGTWNASTIDVSYGGTGATTLTGYVKGTGTAALTAVSSIPTTDLSGTISNAQLANSTISGVALGGNLYNLTFGSGITASSATYNGSAAVSISNALPMVYPAAGIPLSTGTAWETSYSTTGTGTVVALATAATLNNPTVSDYTAYTPTTAPTYAEGRVFYDSTAKTLNYYNDNSQMSVNIGQEQIVRVRNQTGSDIPDGTVVYVNGATGNTPTIALAIATSFATSDIIGVTTTTIANNGFGYVTISGLVNGLDTSAFTEGQAVFLSPTTAGAYTATEPVSPNYSVQVGVILRANPTVGTLLVAVQFISTESSHIVGTVAIANGGTNGTATPTAGAVSYGTGTAYAFSSVGTTGQVLTSSGSGAPTWTTPASAITITDDTTTNTTRYPLFAAATTGSISTEYVSSTKYQFNPSTGVLTSTSFTGAGTGLTGTATSLSIGGNAATATSATTATNLASGATGSVPYQTSSGSTTFLAAGTNGYVMTLSGGVPTWAAAASSGLTITDDTTTNATRYLTFTSATSGSITGEDVSSTKLQYNPSTGALTSVSSIASGTGANTMPVGTTAERPASPQAGMYRLNTTTTEPEWYDTVQSAWVSFGTTPIRSYTANYLVVAGGAGAGGASYSGGGGAGGYKTSSVTLTPAVVYSVTVGAGGAAGGSGSRGTNGNDSSLSGTGITTVTSTGGGGGAAGDSATKDGASGGSGGGGASFGGSSTGTGGSGTSGQGFAGGNGGTDGATYRSGGGGGGSSAVGSNIVAGVGGAGGAGTASSITGSSVIYAGGGGGGGNTSNGAGGAGGGGAAGATGTAGTANTGGGGGGTTTSTSGAGGSGVVILSVPTANYTGIVTGSPTVTTSGSNTIIKFTSSGTYTA